MTEDQLKKLKNACKPTPAMYLSGGTRIGLMPQDRANLAWDRLGKKLGFNSMTVRPVEGKNQRYFTAEPIEKTKDKTKRRP